MLDYLKQEANKTFTENGAVTNVSTGSDCLDLFGTIGALRRESDEEIVARFVRAYTESPDMALKILFFARDIRGGLGERRVFRILLVWLANNEPTTVKKNLQYIADYGRFDDLLCLLGTACERDALELIERQFAVDMINLELGEPVSLMAKWLPSINTSNKDTVRIAKKIARTLGLSGADYRKALSRLRAQIKIIENNLREKDYSFDYEKQPSRAMFKYRKAFSRNDYVRYNEFLSRVRKGEAKLHAGNISPYELIEPYLDYTWGSKGIALNEISPEDRAVLNATWESLTDFGNDENTIAVIDTSGSMYCGGKPLPAAVALSLGLYFAEHSKGCFNNHFVEFSHRPQLLEIKGDTFVDRLRYIMTFSEVADTNLEAVFDMLLNTAVKNHVPQDEMPAKMVIISDMEFNYCIRNASKSVFDNAKESFALHGYKLPTIVFWNVASRNRQQPVTMGENGTVLVSGVTPRLFSMIAGGQTSPYEFMLEVVNSERYARIAA